MDHDLSTAELRSDTRAQWARTSRARRPFEWLARAGLVARGVIYAIIGILAIKLALGDGGKTTDQQGALADDRASSRSARSLLVL